MTYAPVPDRTVGPISVVIPCFRCSATIERAVRSVAAQSVLPIEIILVDDASDDDTLSQLRQLQNRFSTDWIKIIQLNTNSGAGTARNKGWDATKSEFVAFLDADDSWLPNKLETQLGVMSSRPDAVVSGHLSAIDSVSKRSTSTKIFSVKKITFNQLLIANRFVTPSVMVKRDIPFRFRDGQRHMEDHFLWMEIASSGSLILRLEITLAMTYKFPYGKSGLSSNLWLMEKAECGNYIHLAEIGTISRLSAFLLCFFSVIKFFQRILVVVLRRIFRNSP
jgi:glycosyltransferase involved in cell wall biosynthesis